MAAKRLALACIGCTTESPGANAGSRVVMRMLVVVSPTTLPPGKASSPTTSARKENATTAAVSHGDRLRSRPAEPWPTSTSPASARDCAIEYLSVHQWSSRLGDRSAGASDTRVVLVHPVCRVQGAAAA